MENKKDKYEFILGFVGLAISLSAFKEELSLVTINLGFVQFSLVKYFFTIVIGLVICLYLYTIERSLRDTKIGSWKGFDYSIKLAYFIFILLIASPVLLLASWVSTKIVLAVSCFNNEIEKSITAIVSSVIGAISALISSYISAKLRKQKKDKQQEELEYQEIRELEIANKLLNDGYYSQAILETFKVLELHLYKLLQQKDIRVQRHRLIDIINFAVKMELINSNELSIINEIRTMRNTAAHLDIQHTKEQAEKAVGFVKILIKRNS